MPELPDVEVQKQYMDATSLHQTIARTKVTDTRILHDTSVQALGRRLKGSAFEQTTRHGKYLFARISAGGWLILHFGMTGELDYGQTAADLPEHTRVIFTFENDARLAYVSLRMLGQVGFTENVERFIEQEDLGPDALADDLDADRFVERLAAHKGAAKTTLMDQSIVAGLGNIWADEVLFQSGVHPKARIDALSEETLKTLYRNTRRICRTAVRHQIVVEELPRTYLLRHRDTDHRCPKCGSELKRIKIGSRTSHFCPRCQKKP